jgi:hypothetical protein
MNKGLLVKNSQQRQETYRNFITFKKNSLMFFSLLLLFFSPTINLNNAKDSIELDYVRAADNHPNYKVTYLSKNDIRIDGDVNEKSWHRCEVIKNLAAPWDSGAAGTARFRACYDENFFYFSFQVTDSIALYLEEKNEEAVAKGDRVEVFFSPDTAMSNYYCLEIAPNGNLLDYQASYHRNFNSTWNIEGAEIVGKPNANGYMVEGKIPVGFLKTLKGIDGSLNGVTILGGVFRARKKSIADPEAFIWYSWINPHVASPDFHIPSALGRFEF